MDPLEIANRDPGRSSYQGMKTDSQFNYLKRRLSALPHVNTVVLMEGGVLRLYRRDAREDLEGYIVVHADGDVEWRGRYLDQAAVREARGVTGGGVRCQPRSGRSF